jgi:hypothetical protein
MRPEEVGLTGVGRGPVSGRRREELAMLAEVSPDYCVRLNKADSSPRWKQSRHLP